MWARSFTIPLAGLQGRVREDKVTHNKGAASQKVTHGSSRTPHRYSDAWLISKLTSKSSTRINSHVMEAPAETSRKETTDANDDKRRAKEPRGRREHIINMIGEVNEVPRVCVDMATVAIRYDSERRRRLERQRRLQNLLQVEEDLVPSPQGLMTALRNYLTWNNTVLVLFAVIVGASVYIIMKLHYKKYNAE